MLLLLQKNIPPLAEGYNDFIFMLALTVSIHSCLCILVLWFWNPSLRKTNRTIAKKGTHVVKDSRVFLKLSLPGGTNSLCTFFLFLSFFRSADNSVIKRTACTCHSFNDNKKNQQLRTAAWLAPLVFTERSIFSLNQSRIQIPTETSVNNSNHEHRLMLICPHDVDMFTWGRIVLSLPKRAHVDWNWPILREIYLKIDWSVKMPFHWLITGVARS